MEYPTVYFAPRFQRDQTKLKNCMAVIYENQGGKTIVQLIKQTQKGVFEARRKYEFQNRPQVFQPMTIENIEGTAVAVPFNQDGWPDLEGGFYRIYPEYDLSEPLFRIKGNVLAMDQEELQARQEYQKEIQQKRVFNPFIKYKDDYGDRYGYVKAINKLPTPDWDPLGRTLQVERIYQDIEEGQPVWNSSGPDSIKYKQIKEWGLQIGKQNRAYFDTTRNEVFAKQAEKRINIDQYWLEEDNHFRGLNLRDFEYVEDYLKAYYPTYKSIVLLTTKTNKQIRCHIINLALNYVRVGVLSNEKTEEGVFLQHIFTQANFGHDSIKSIKWPTEMPRFDKQGRVNFVWVQTSVEEYFAGTPEEPLNIDQKTLKIVQTRRRRPTRTVARRAQFNLNVDKTIEKLSEWPQLNRDKRKALIESFKDKQAFEQFLLAMKSGSIEKVQTQACSDDQYELAELVNHVQKTLRAICNTLRAMAINIPKDYEYGNGDSTARTDDMEAFLSWLPPDKRVQEAKVNLMKYMKALKRDLVKMQKQEKKLEQAPNSANRGRNDLSIGPLRL